MHRIETQVEVNASAETVWSVLLDFAAYPSWNPFVRSIEGSPEPGKQLRVFLRPPGSKGMTFRPTVLTVTPGREFRWKGKLLVPGLFDGEHFFSLEPRQENQVVFHHGELFSGLLVPFLKGTLDGATKQGFVAMNEALKREAEKR
ncbi:MAG: SRPBCC domain-containing protein [Deltaproteobacteria bacterium]|nr:SRPBCC domain-containing protein [Deltaproteobacteria bacterium]